MRVVSAAFIGIGISAAIASTSSAAVDAGGTGSDQLSSSKIADVKLQICRLPGIDADTPRVITIPAGTRFDDGETTEAWSPHLVAAPARTVATVETRMAAVLPVDHYCIDVPAVPTSGTGPTALAGAEGQMFAVSARDQLALLGEVYGSIESGTPATAVPPSAALTLPGH